MLFPEDILIEALDKIYVPRRGEQFSAGYDLVTHTVSPSLGDSPGDYLIPSQATVKLHCGFRMALPRNYFALIVPRSSWRRQGLLCLSVYDPGYLDFVEPFVTNLSDSALVVHIGERVLQMLILPLERLELVTVGVLPDSLYNRGGGAGSTGK